MKRVYSSNFAAIGEPALARLIVALLKGVNDDAGDEPGHRVSEEDERKGKHDASALVLIRQSCKYVCEKSTLVLTESIMKPSPAE
jgi:hypothetical protein